jgi:hypothetical protein
LRNVFGMKFSCMSGDVKVRSRITETSRIKSRGTCRIRDSESFTGPGAYMTMSGHLVDHGLRSLVAIVLLAVVSSPILPTMASLAAYPANFFSRNHATCKAGHSSQFAMSARPRLREADCLPSEIQDDLEADIEDESTVTTPLASVSFDVLPSPCPQPYSTLICIVVASAARPLRC